MVRALCCVGSFGPSGEFQSQQLFVVLARGPNGWSCSLVPCSAPGFSSSSMTSQAGEDRDP